ncbi:hypothetical protein [Clostridium sp. BJN0001]|uniref:hypothetical protein n=1 Tax=Clostridium sp. BJN0001 TaxID=2930219 RepID=UPI001FD11FCD|nr:hypothetical protein [Clostridium sp. BJN0001]
MDINKAVKKEKSHTKIFLTAMSIIAFLLPCILYLSGIKIKLFYIMYLVIIEFLILISILAKLNFYLVKYKCKNNRLKFKVGLFSNEYVLLCNSVKAVHTMNSDYDIEIILITDIKLRNKGLRVINDKTLKRHKYILKMLKNIEDYDKNKVYYIEIIKRGGLKKYFLLDCIYKNCVKAFYTDECIQSIKIARGQMVV